MGAFLTALGTVLGENIATLITIMLTGGIGYCCVSPRGRLIVKSAFNWMFSTTANNPKLAAGAYDEKISSVRKLLREAEELNQEAKGKLAEESDRFEKAQREYKKYSQQAVTLENRGEHEKAILMAREASVAQRKMNVSLEKIPDYQATSEATNQRVNELKAKITEYEQRKEETISNMEKGKFEKKVSETLKGLDTSDIDSYIKQIEESATDTKYKAIGARMSYEASDVKKLRDAEEAANTVDAEDFLRGLMAESTESN